MFGLNLSIFDDLNLTSLLSLTMTFRFNLIDLTICKINEYHSNSLTMQL